MPVQGSKSPKSPQPSSPKVTLIEESKLPELSRQTSSDSQLERERPEVAAAIKRIEEIYNAGTPMFTKEALRDLAQQLDSPGVRSGETNRPIVIRGLDGKNVQKMTRSGNVDAVGGHTDIVRVNVSPMILYVSYDSLTGTLRRSRRSDVSSTAFLTTVVGGRLEYRYRDADGVMNPHGSNSIGMLAKNLADGRLTMEPLQDYLNRLAYNPMDELRTYAQAQRAEWEAGAPCAELRATMTAALAPRLRPRGDMVIRKVIMFAGGSMTCSYSDRSRKRSTVQHAMMLTMRDVVTQLQAAGGSGSGSGNASEDGEITVQCMVQDPVYDDADIALLAEDDVTVVNDPHGFLHVDETSVVISIAPNIAVRQIVADIARPAVVIWSHVLEEEPPPTSKGSIGWTDPTSPRVVAMVRDEYTEMAFPDDQFHFGTINGTSIYVRNTPKAFSFLMPSIRGGRLIHRLQKVLSC